MASLRVTDDAIADLERLTDFLRKEDPMGAEATTKLILGGLDVLEVHPLIGRLLDADLRELVISRGRSGYLALYRYDPHDDSVMVHAIRHQRESGFDE